MNGLKGTRPLEKLEVAHLQMAQMEKTMHWWSDCTFNKQGKWNKVCNECNRMDAFVKEATEHKCERLELLNEIEMLKLKIGKLDQLRLLKKNLDTYVSPQAETDNIKDIPPNIAGNTINKNLEGIEDDAELEELVAMILLRTIMESLNLMLTHQSEH